MRYIDCLNEWLIIIWLLCLLLFFAEGVYLTHGWVLLIPMVVFVPPFFLKFLKGLV